MKQAIGKIGENLKPAFKIYRENDTIYSDAIKDKDGWVTIYVEEWRLTKEYINFKIQKYNYLGYSVKFI